MRTPMIALQNSGPLLEVNHFDGQIYSGNMSMKIGVGEIESLRRDLGGLYKRDMSVGYSSSEQRRTRFTNASGGHPNG